MSNACKKFSHGALVINQNKNKERGGGRREERRKEKETFPRKLLIDAIGSGSVDILAEHRY